MSNSQNTKARHFPKPLVLTLIALIAIALAILVILAVVVAPRLVNHLPDKAQMRALLPAMSEEKANALSVEKPADLSGAAATGIECECVDYFIYKLNNSQRVDGDWPTAASMASDDYWKLTAIPRSRSSTAQVDDIIIMQGNAIVYPWNVNTNTWDLYFETNTIGGGAGHIGIVLSAEYWENEGGWYIYMQSANWSPSWGTLFSDAGCDNVSDSYIFVPNGDLVSFWRK